MEPSVARDRDTARLVTRDRNMAEVVARGRDIADAVAMAPPRRALLPGALTWQRTFPGTETWRRAEVTAGSAQTHTAQWILDHLVSEASRQAETRRPVSSPEMAQYYLWLVEDDVSEGKILPRHSSAGMVLLHLLDWASASDANKCFLFAKGTCSYSWMQLVSFCPKKMDMCLKFLVLENIEGKKIKIGLKNRFHVLQRFQKH